MIVLFIMPLDAGGAIAVAVTVIDSLRYRKIAAARGIFVMPEESSLPPE